MLLTGNGSWGSRRARPLLVLAPLRHAGGPLRACPLTEVDRKSPVFDQTGVNDPSAISGSHASRFHVMPDGLSQRNLLFHAPGEVITESTDADHWAENTSSEPDILISVDLFK